MAIVAGLDVGGAHLKVALVANAKPVEVRQIVCPLWQGLDKLDAALIEAAPLLERADRFAITMTGELSDLFPDRPRGVATLADRLTRACGRDARFWMGRRGFGDAAQAKANAADVGSTNFLATAQAAARLAPYALLVDLGSTTADIIPIADGRPVPRGLTDADRQVTGELVYTGLTRTPVMGVTRRAPLAGQWVSLAREHLATMADVQRILGLLPEGVDLHATADGRGKCLSESVARFARMLGRDAAEVPLRDWRNAAAWVREAQMHSLVEGAFQVVSAAELPPESPVVVAGIGAGMVEEMAVRLARHSVTFGALIGASGDVAVWSTRCAPAVAVALLADQ